MHPAAMKGFTSNLEALPAGFRHGGQIRALDLGGADVNGTVHAALAGWLDLAQLDVLDIAPGPGVTIVGDARETNWFHTGSAEPYDIVISTEMLEHVDGWPDSIETAATVLRPGGWFIGTAASIGRRPHGARGEYDPPTGEHYGNVSVDTLVYSLRAWFDHIDVQYQVNGDPTTCDVYWRAQRPGR